MCGITGAIWTDPKQGIDAATLQKMTDVIRHRGPDDDGYYHSEYRLRPPYEALPGVALGFRRLSIIDLEGGHQPMSNEDGTVWVVFNGEIYNYPTIRRRLEGAGHTFRTQSDTETIVHLYEDEGLDFVQHLNGMFAIAIWDSRLRRLVLARDRIGQKPLVYHAQHDRLLFASELKSLLQVDGISREVDPGAIDEYLTYQYVPHPKTIFRGMNKLPPGHVAVFQDGKLDVRPYWQPNFSSEISIGPSAAAENLTELLSSSVEMRMRSDVPLGAFLSGGIDSSLIVALMQQRSEQSIKTFTIGFPVPEYDETSYARQVSEHLGTDHEELEVTPSGVDILPKLVWQYDEPFADSSAIPTWYVSEMTRRKVTVALSGDGSDELFAGYPRYRAVWLASLLDDSGPIRSFLGAPWWQRLPGSRQKSFLRRFKRFSEFLRKTPQRRYLEWIAIFNESRRAMLYRDEFVEQLPNADPFSFLSDSWGRTGGRDVVSGASLADVTTYLTCDLMTKVDIASMAHSLEVRQPFLDYRVVEFAASLPVSLKFRRGAGKRLLRAAFGHLLPSYIWNRKKMGFGVPLDHWFRDQLRELTHDVLLDESARTRSYFRGEAVEEMVRQHENRQFDHSYRLWALLVLELWLREWC
jgi:asparagine synthase (glutamine-hydrolysing)